jgi:hypothetical protein
MWALLAKLKRQIRHMKKAAAAAAAADATAVHGCTVAEIHTLEAIVAEMETQWAYDDIWGHGYGP